MLLRTISLTASLLKKLRQGIESGQQDKQRSKMDASCKMYLQCQWTECIWLALEVPLIWIKIEVLTPIYLVVWWLYGKAFLGMAFNTTDKSSQKWQLFGLH